MSILMSLYSSSNSIYPMRKKAGKEKPGVIDQPNLVLFGTAIPKHYYEALNQKMLTNGFFARMMVFESGKRQDGQDAEIKVVPSTIIEHAAWWRDYQPMAGNIASLHPEPRILQHTPDAKETLNSLRKNADREYSHAEEKNNQPAMTVWGRVNEQARKLALLYAISADREATTIGSDAAEWAASLTMHQARRMLYMAELHVAENPHDAQCLKIIQIISAKPDKKIGHSELLKRMKIDAKSFISIISTMIERGDLVRNEIPHDSRTKGIYALPGAET
jgi:hypothetical protein